MRTVTILGVAFVLAGTVLLTVPAYGFSTSNADRGVAVQTAEDSDALLEITDSSQEAAVTPESPTAIFDLLDTTGQIDDVTVISASITGVEATALDVTATPTDADRYSVTVACHESERETAATVTVTLETSGTVHVVADRTTDHALQIECETGEDTYSESSVTDDVVIEGDSRFEEPVDIKGGGSISGEGALTFEDELEIRGSGGIDVDGDITFEETVEISGAEASITAGGDITFKNGVEISGAGNEPGESGLITAAGEIHW
ncbi:hypothetical protein [Natronobacterium gregoryi]|uniref:Uncharacterized protein n=2 Tax=Natronobacterium gregoryi TaxID=44930 RepID=L0AMU1_NATGS|nr:hypothetical protein [Natronobacterium gregoryi]AFZ74517.1 hypothetical protein Natgr_3397 [Natronobacterium gregoryi SP2]ELY72409.1 hypothetical protein C490_03658 [Natronobacterium gregoryi SP2]PLK21737.1 hypothetical protein CYV19_02565 [Natronobacterium gregoryi SP2]SFI97721.1 hypothetical protein SAMN05443661_110190 [Natronobacterium gregoryi]